MAKDVGNWLTPLGVLGGSPARDPGVLRCSRDRDVGTWLTPLDVLSESPASWGQEVLDPGILEWGHGLRDSIGILGSADCGRPEASSPRETTQESIPKDSWILRIWGILGWGPGQPQ